MKKLKSELSPEEYEAWLLSGTRNEQIARVSESQLLLVVVRNAQYTQSPEARMWLAVFGQAIHDRAAAFFDTAWYRYVASLLGLNPGPIREIVLEWIKHNPPESRAEQRAHHAAMLEEARA